MSKGADGGLRALGDGGARRIEQDQGTSLQAMISPLIRFTRLKRLMKYQNLLLATTVLTAKTFMRKIFGVGSFSVGLCRPTTWYRCIESVESVILVMLDPKEDQRERLYELQDRLELARLPREKCVHPFCMSGRKRLWCTQTDFGERVEASNRDQSVFLSVLLQLRSAASLLLGHHD